MTKIAKLTLIAMISITASVPRLPMGLHVADTGGKKGDKILLVLTLLGMVWVVGFVTLVDTASVQPFTPLYWLWGVGSLLSGFGISTFPMIVNTLYWSKPWDCGENMGKMGGLGNISPGIFLAIITTFLVVKPDLKLLIYIWLPCHALATYYTCSIIVNPPSH